MSASRSLRRAVGELAVALAGVALLAPAVAADSAKAAKPAAKPARKAPVVVDVAVADAQPEQVKAAELVYYGVYDCEFQQTVQITQSAKHSAYVDVRSNKSNWLMRPVLSSTGAIRLEDVRGETLMVQIAAKSMLLNVRSAQRIVDDCISPKQRELIAEAKEAKEAKAAKAAAEAAPVKAIADAATGNPNDAVAATPPK